LKEKFHKKKYPKIFFEKICFFRNLKKNLKKHKEKLKNDNFFEDLSFDKRGCTFS